MAARALKLGDIGDAAPEHWKSALDPGHTHVIATFHADEQELLDEIEALALGGDRGGGWKIAGRLDGANFDNDNVHFGYHDNISQPRFEGVHDPARYPDDQPLAPLGTVLLGYPTAFEGVTWRIPDPDVLGRNGAFNAFRLLVQRVGEFEEYLDDAAEEVIHHPLVDELLPPGAESAFGAPRRDALREVIAAKLCGRWRTGVPLALSPNSPAPEPEVSLTEYDYLDDTDGVRCPFGSHVRRCNPRGGAIVQRVSNHTRRLVRRGIPYGPAFDRSSPDNTERGLLGNFLCADLAAEFEAVQYDWMNLGLQDPRLMGTNDPLLGANDPDHSAFEIPVRSGSIRITGFPRFVIPRGGAYTFLPSLSALRHIGRG